MSGPCELMIMVFGVMLSAVRSFIDGMTTLEGSIVDRRVFKRASGEEIVAVGYVERALAGIEFEGFGGFDGFLCLDLRI